MRKRTFERKQSLRVVRGMGKLGEDGEYGR
jgi:hypothetical protein